MDEKQMRQAARAFSALIETPDAELAKFASRHLDRPVAPPQLAQVRDVLRLLYALIEQDDELGWEALSAAHEQLGAAMTGASGQPAAPPPQPPAAPIPTGEPAAPTAEPSPPVYAQPAPAAPASSAAISRPPAAIPVPPAATPAPPAAPAPPPAAPAPPPAAPAPVGPPPSGGDMTVGFSGQVMARVTPFSGQAAAPPPAATSPPASPDADSGTAALNSSHLAAHVGAANPYDRGRVGFPQLTVQQYAKFCAHVAEQPEQLHDTYASFGVADQNAHHLLHDHWKQQLASDPTTRQLFDMLYQRIRGQLRSKG